MSDSSENQHKETITTWNKLAKLYEEKFMHLDIYQTTYDVLIEAVSKEKAEVFEIGCGPGNISFYILHRCPFWEWKGIDAASSMVELANQNNPLAHFEVGDARRLHLPDKSHDALIAGFCIPYLSLAETEHLISQASRFLRVGGVLYLSYVPGSPERSGFQTSSTGDRSYFYFFQSEQIQNLLLGKGFEVIRTFHVPYQESEVHEVIIARLL